MLEISVFACSDRDVKEVQSGIGGCRDWRVRITWIGFGACGNPAFMSAREVSVKVDMMM
jgi:hypothetical protein